jgi:hypothetical protein
MRRYFQSPEVVENIRKAKIVLLAFRALMRPGQVYRHILKDNTGNNVKLYFLQTSTRTVKQRR